MPDPALHLAVMQALADSPHVHADEIAVEADGADVILRGTVGSAIQRAQAARAVRGVPGVERVDDQLRVRLMGIDGGADADTEAAVIDALIASDDVHVGDIDVEASGGTVTLRGVVELPAQRDTAQRIAMAVPGVAQVENRLRVWLTVSADDVAERVTDALGAGALVGPEQVTVNVVDNDVTLTGAVASDGHRQAAVAAAAGAPGVAEVHDHLTVRPAPSSR